MACLSVGFVGFHHGGVKEYKEEYPNVQPFHTLKFETPIHHGLFTLKMGRLLMSITTRNRMKPSSFSHFEAAL